MRLTESEIRGQIAKVIQAHDDWAGQENPSDEPPEEFGESLMRFGEIGMAEDGIRKKLPDSAYALDLLEDMFTVLREWAKYITDEGSVLPIAFQRAFRVLVSRYQGGNRDRPPVRRPPESVQDLLESKHGGWQIARMYGMRVDGLDTGPFFTEHGTPDEARILQEARSPGSVLGEDWVHPRYQKWQEDQEKKVSVLQERLQPFAEIFLWSDKPEPAPEDPDTIEELLRQGQYPSVIARVKKVSLEEVFEVAAQLGIQPNSKQNPEPWRYIPAEPPEEPQPETEERTAPASQYTSEEVIALVLSARDENADANTQEIADQINEETGLNLSRQKVQHILKAEIPA